MAMNVASNGDEDEVMSAINTTPLVDVMLVLLIIFLITIPVAIQTVPVELPKASSEINQTEPRNITIAVDADGHYYWNASRVETREEMLKKLIEAAQADTQPEIQVRGDRMTRFESVGRLILDIQRAGIHKVGFITEPVQGS
ncbi:biopolymer transporter ExbD [Parvibaculum sp.]|uniref:ExbD/TolR family protein n=1 Tax=Parvibaculum sp. TaxID=2024848 RepID=UPI00272F1F7E|nr:biopolymer transporter ExbD [Parvibaculum sp.]MDP1627606.1 biopolymer transporter ExbD [Parvibaculum sp.]MDP2148785.1 biopolymer transporter ExbD [Parvibaculum sp.]MDP3328691.1 biopolymer transporter ExbD [Parvibaculum sp.]